MAPKKEAPSVEAAIEHYILPPTPKKWLRVGEHRIGVFELVDVPIEDLPRAQEIVRKVSTASVSEDGPEIRTAIFEYLRIVAPGVTDEQLAAFRTVRQLSSVIAFVLHEAEQSDPLTVSRPTEASSAKAA